MLLEMVVDDYNAGESAEEIARSFDTLDLADVHAVISYYLRHRAAVDAYLAERRRQANELRGELQARFPNEGLRERLRARRTGQNTGPE